MLKGYFDASGKGARDIFVLAGCISTAQRWASFTEHWQAELNGGTDEKKRQPMKLFKLAKVRNLGRCAIFHKILLDHIIAQIAVVVDAAALMKVMRNSWWTPFLDRKIEPADSAYWFGFRVLNEVFHIERKKREELKPLSGPIDLTFDQENESDKMALVRGWQHLHETSAPEKREIIGKMPNFARDDLVLPLQGADLVAGIARRLAAHGQSIRGLPVPWEKIASEARAPVLTITMQYKESDIRRNLDRVVMAQVKKQLGEGNAP